MNKQYDVKATIVSIKEPCGAGHEVGDSFCMRRRDGLGLRLEGSDGWCPELIATALSPMGVMAFGGELAWEDEEGKACSACPDPHCCVVVAVERMNPGESEG